MGTGYDEGKSVKYFGLKMLERKNQGQNDDSNSVANNSKIPRQMANVESLVLTGKPILDWIFIFLNNL